MPDRGRDDVTLSERERQVLMEIEAQLGGGAGARRPSLGSVVQAMPGWLAAVLVAAGGAVLVVAAFTVSFMMALAGALLLAAGVGLGCVRLIRVVLSWFSTEASSRR